MGWMLHSGNGSSVNKSKADLDYVSVNEQSTERGRGDRVRGRKFSKLAWEEKRSAGS